MTVLYTLLFGMLAGLIILKVALLAAAAVLLLHGWTGRIRQRGSMAVADAVKHPGLDLHA